MKRSPRRATRRATRVARSFTVLALAGVTLAPAAVAQAAPQQTADRPDGRTARPHAATQEALDAITRDGTPGALALAVDRDGAWYGRSGTADLRTGRPRVAEERFRTGSVTKPFLATVLLQLTADPAYGMSLDDPVDKWLPGLVRGNGHDGSRITLRQLLQHTSGIYSYNQDAGFQAKFKGEAFLEHRFDGATPRELVDIAMSHRPDFEPGREWKYSNTNYVLVGMVIERATGGSYAEQVRERIIEPLRLRGTSLPGTDPTLPRPHARHYSTLGAKEPGSRLYDVTEYDPSITGASGEIISTVRDMSTFMRALVRGELLPAAQQREMFTPTGPAEAVGYGLGITRFTLCGPGRERTVWGHNGDVPSSLSVAVSTADGRHTLALNRNGDGGPDELEEDVLEAEFCA